MGIDKAEPTKLPETGVTTGLFDELLDRREHTVGGMAVGFVRDLMDTGATPDVLRNARAKSHDEIAMVAADTVAFLPSLRWTAGGAVRAAILIDPHAGLSDNALSFGKNFLEGAALNKVGKLAAPEGMLARAATARFGQGLLAESITHMGVGLGMGAVKTGFNPLAWQDKGGNFSLAAGAENLVKNSLLAGAVNVPAGMLGTRISKAATVGLSEGVLSARSAALISGMGSGYASGIVFGGLDGLAQGKSWTEILADMHKGGIVGAVTGGFVHGYEQSRATSRMRESLYQRLGDEPHAAGKDKNPASRDGTVVAKEREVSEAWLNEALDIELKPLTARDHVELTRRLHPPQAAVEMMLAPKAGAAGPFKSYEHFLKVATVEKQVPVRVYKVAGHSAEIVVPEAYAKKLDEVRVLRQAVGQSHVSNPSRLADVIGAKARLAEHPLGDRALPEDFVHLLDQIPDRSLLRRFYVVDGEDPQNPWLAQTHKQESFRSAAEAGEDGHVTFFSPKTGQPLREFVFHEWAHLVKFKFQQHSVNFDLAAKLEKDGFYTRDYARVNDHENFAVHMGEDLLHWDADVFANVTDQAPVRSAIFGQALVSVLQKAPAWARSTFHPQYMERVRYLEQQVLPRAQDVLVEKIGSGDLATKKLAMQLLGTLGNKSHLDLVKQYAGKGNHPELAELALDAGLQLSRSVSDKLNLLMEVGRPGSPVHEIAVDLVKRMPDERGPSYWRLLAWSGSAENLPDLVKLVDQMPDSRGRKMAFDEAWRLAQSSNDLYHMGQLITRAPDAASKELAFRTVQDKLKGKEPARAQLAIRALEQEPQLRVAAIDVLASLKLPFTEAHIARFATDSNPAVARRAKEVLTALNETANFARLASRSRNGSDQSRITAIRELGESSDMQAVRPLLEALATDTSPARSVALEASVALRHFSRNLVKFEAQQLAREHPEWSQTLRKMVINPGS